eukprot:COSAG01_NODE_8226_length_2867_cov_2.022760_5_plen_77_part_00
MFLHFGAPIISTCTRMLLPLVVAWAGRAGVGEGALAGARGGGDDAGGADHRPVEDGDAGSPAPRAAAGGQAGRRRG